MTTLPIQRDSSTSAIVPVPRAGITINVRSAAIADLPFIDALQKMHSHMVGFLPSKQIEKRIADGDVLVAEEIASNGSGAAVQVGYVIAHDQYMKRDDVGIVYQLNVLPLRQRHLVGAMLIKSVFERAAYGCRLFSCWCAQDIQANWFWESIGFVPLAFRTDRAKQRIHIFWQRRVREGDDGPLTGGTPYWFPSQTSAGAVGEDRIVLPIPVGTHWRDAKPLVLPGLPASGGPSQELPAMLPGGSPVKSRPAPQQPKLTAAQKAAIHRSQCKALGGVPVGKKAVITSRGIKYVARDDYVPELDAPEALAAATRPKRAAGKPRQKNDPKYVAAARELRDRYLEQVNTDRMLPGGGGGGSANGKYDVSRQLPEAPTNLTNTPLLNAA